jgi:hypothetical protein
MSKTKRAHEEPFSLDIELLPPSNKRIKVVNNGAENKKEEDDSWDNAFDELARMSKEINEIRKKLNLEPTRKVKVKIKKEESSAVL